MKTKTYTDKESGKKFYLTVIDKDKTNDGREMLVCTALLPEQSDEDFIISGGVFYPNQLKNESVDKDTIMFDDCGNEYKLTDNGWEVL